MKVSTVPSANNSAVPTPDPVADYLAGIPKESTRRAYRSSLYHFLDALYGPVRAARTCSPAEALRYEDLARALLGTADPAAVLPRYVVALAPSPPTSAAQRLAVAIDWLSYHGREVTQRDRKALSRRLPKGGAQTMEGDLDHETLRAIVQQADLRLRAVVLVLASSGMRIGELLQATVRDLDLAAVPAEVAVRGQYTKTGAPRTVFLSAEAADAVREWLKVRDERQVLAVRRSAGVGGKRKDNRLFPYEPKTIRSARSSADGPEQPAAAIAQARRTRAMVIRMAIGFASETMSLAVRS